MTIQQWSDAILVVELADEIDLAEEINTLINRLENSHPAHVVMNLQSVRYINSTNIAQLLRVRQKLVSNNRRFVLSNVPDEIWGVMLVTGLDKVFDFKPQVSDALTDLQLADRS